MYNCISSIDIVLEKRYLNKGDTTKLYPTKKDKTQTAAQRIRNKWWLLVTLQQNPSLIKYRKRNLDYK
jgi:hypothetical protein